MLLIKILIVSNYNKFNEFNEEKKKSLQIKSF
jgi:hypothetical protein